jgi:inner membrane protein
VSPITHLLVGWVVANTARLDRRERAVVTLAGVIPDLDGLGLVAELATRSWEHPLLWWTDYHHVLAHNLSFGVLVVSISLPFVKQRWLTAVLAMWSFHLHLIGDLVGGGGPDGFQWPMHYLYPFSDAWQWAWRGQWALNAWPNMLLTAMLLVATLALARKQGYSPLELLSGNADCVFVATLRQRFPLP